MPDDEEKLDPVVEALRLMAKHASENQAKDDAVYAMVPPIIQSMTDLVREVRRSEISIEDVEIVVKKKTAHLASQQSVDDLENAFNETFGWLRRVVQWVKKIPKWLYVLAAVCSIVGIGVNDIWPIWPKIKGLLGLQAH